jgi:hypothetical protein
MVIVPLDRTTFKVLDDLYSQNTVAYIYYADNYFHARMPSRWIKTEDLVPGMVIEKQGLVITDNIRIQGDNVLEYINTLERCIDELNDMLNG